MLNFQSWKGVEAILCEGRFAEALTPPRRVAVRPFPVPQMSLRIPAPIPRGELDHTGCLPSGFVRYTFLLCTTSLLGADLPSCYTT